MLTIKTYSTWFGTLSKEQQLPHQSVGIVISSSEVLFQVSQLSKVKQVVIREMALSIGAPHFWNAHSSSGVTEAELLES